MSVARDDGTAALPPGAALELWLDAARWPAWVDGFGRLDRVDERWPEPGATAVWRSRPGGRGTVTEQVVDLEPASRITVDVSDDQLGGRQTVTFEASPGGCHVLVELDYKLNGGGPLMALADKIFIRRTMRDSIRRTLARFATEAADAATVPHP